MKSAPRWKATRRRLLALAAAVGLVAGVGACAGPDGSGSGGSASSRAVQTPEPPAGLDVTEVRLWITGFEPAYAGCFIISPDGAVAYYDYTMSWATPNGGISGPGADYDSPESTRQDYQLVDQDWDSIVAALDQVGFMDLPEEIESNGVMDGAAHWIDVDAGGVTHAAGGYMPQGQNSGFDAAYDAVQKALQQAGAWPW